jgi:hypothetical protein
MALEQTLSHFWPLENFQPHMAPCGHAILFDLAEAHVSPFDLASFIKICAKNH